MPVQLPGDPQRRADVVAAMHDDRRDVADAAGVGDQLVIELEKSAVDEVMALDPREGEGVGVGSRNG